MSNHVFGPVPSRRLGRSLGVDLVPFKTCTYDCIYCQLGPGADKTLKPREWVPLDDVLKELEPRLVSRPDYITLSGSGEPTLHSRIGELIDRIKAMTDVPVAVLTNGSLLWQQEIRARLMNADLIIPSLDAGDEATYRAINRPHEEISFDTMVKGLVDLRREFRGQCWLEVFLLEGHNTDNTQVKKMAELAKSIGPDRVQLNTVSRPPAESYAIGVSPDKMAELALLFDPPAEVIADFAKMGRQPELSARTDDVLEMVRRRPCSVDDIADGLGIHLTEAAKLVNILADKKLIEEKTVGGKTYYAPR